jgi:transcriptional regulator with XRE-family HTH domain
VAKDDPHDQRDDQSLGDLGGYIRAQRKQAQLSLRKLASLAGVSNPYLSQIERGLRNPSAEILQAIARGLEISSETLYVQAGILDPDHAERTDVETAIVRARELTEGQRTSLLEMYRSFRRLAALERGEDPDAPPPVAAGDHEPAVDVAPPRDADTGDGAEPQGGQAGGDDPDASDPTARDDDA